MACVPCPSGRRAAARFVLLVLVVVLAAGPVRAQEMDASYRVRDVRVEATAQDAVAARAQAIEQGQQQALDRLVERLTSDGDAAVDLSDVPIEDLVSSLEVLEETVGPKSYAATLEVAFDREAVQELLDERGIAYAASAAEPVLLVPLWETGAGLRLWESDNAWKLAWDRALDPDAVAPFVVPLGDLQDLSLLNPDQAVRGDVGALMELADHYGTEAVVVARLQGSGEPGTALEVAARRYGDGPSEPYRAVVRRGPEEPLVASLERAVAEMQAAYDARFRERRTVRGGRSEPLIVTAPVEGLDGWGRLLRTLDDLVEVERAQVRRFSQREATIELRVAGGLDRLRESLGRRGWRLTEGGATGLRLERGDATTGTPTL